MANRRPPYRTPERFVPSRELPGQSSFPGGRTPPDDDEPQPGNGIRALILRALAAQGRGGDDELAHVNPAEARALMRAGGSGGINPRTGLREFQTGGDGSSDDGSGGLGGGVGGPSTDYGHANAPSNQGGNYDRQREADARAASVSPSGVSVNAGHIPGSAAGLAAGQGGAWGAGTSDLGGAAVDGGTGGGGGVSAADYTPGMAGSPIGTMSPLPGSPVTNESQVAMAQDALKNRSWGEKVLDTLGGLIGLDPMTPDINNPASYTGGTWHEGWSPAGLVGGLIGSALAGPMGGMALSKLGGWAGPTIATGDWGLSGGPNPAAGPAGTSAPGAATASSGGAAAPASGGGGILGTGIGPNISEADIGHALLAGPRAIGDALSGGVGGAMPAPASGRMGGGQNRQSGERDRAYKLARIGLLMNPYA